MAQLYSRNFPSLASFSNNTFGFNSISGAMVWDSGNGFGGISGRWRCTLSATAAYGLCQFPALGTTPTDFHMAGWLLPGTLATAADGANFQYMAMRSAFAFLGGLQIRREGGLLVFRHIAVEDGGGEVWEEVSLESGWPEKVEIHLHRGAGDGYQYLYFIGGIYNANGVRMGDGLLGLNNSSQFSLIDRTRHGATNISGAWTGTLYGDEQRARNDATWIFVVPGIFPTLSVPSAQSLKYGAGRVITPITATPGGGQIIRANLSCEALMTITVVPSGGAAVTGNTSNAVTVTGLQADVLATIVSVVVGKARQSLSEWFTNNTITVLITDSNNETASGVIPVQWSPASGEGTDSFRFTGNPTASIAVQSQQIRDALAAIGWTPLAEGSASLFMYSTTSEAITDEDVFGYTVSAPIPSVDSSQAVPTTLIEDQAAVVSIRVGYRAP